MIEIMKIKRSGYHGDRGRVQQEYADYAINVKGVEVHKIEGYNAFHSSIEDRKATLARAEEYARKLSLATGMLWQMSEKKTYRAYFGPQISASTPEEARKLFKDMVFSVEEV